MSEHVMFLYRFPVVRGVQANKEYFIGMLPLEYLSKLFPDDPDVVAPEFRAQRRVNEQRIPAIRDYVLKNRNSYVFSALSASIDGHFNFIPSTNSLDLGILEVEMNAVFLINDGQHRKASLQAAIEEDPSLKTETISIVFFKDEGLQRSQQMFTDLNKHAVKTSNSISELYDNRDRIAVINRTVIASVNFLNTYTDKERDNLGKFSSNLFTLNTFYLTTKNILKTSNGDDEFDIKFLCQFWETIINNIEPWQDLLKHEISKKDLRENFIITQGVVVQALGVIGKHFYDQRKTDGLQFDLNGLKTIDWRRTAREWKDRVVRSDGKILTSKKAIQLTAVQIKKNLKIALSPSESHLDANPNSEKRK